jgi:hypothetical protein
VFFVRFMMSRERERGCNVSKESCMKNGVGLWLRERASECVCGSCKVVSFNSLQRALLLQVAIGN